MDDEDITADQFDGHDLQFQPPAIRTHPAQKALSGNLSRTARWRPAIHDLQRSSTSDPMFFAPNEPTALASDQ